MKQLQNSLVDDIHHQIIKEMALNQGKKKKPKNRSEMLNIRMSSTRTRNNKCNSKI
jgi:hypothetical protein